MHDAALRGDGIELGVRQIARLVDERAHGRVARDDGRTRELERLHDGARGELRHVDDDAELVEPPHRGAAELRQPAVRLVAWNGRSRRIGKRVVARVIEREHAHAGLDVAVDQTRVRAERVRVLEADEHGDPPAGVNTFDVRGRERQGQARGVVGDERSNARELGIDLGACSRNALGGRGAGRRLDRERHGGEPARDELVDGHLRDAVVRAIDAGRRRHQHVDVRVERRGGRVHGTHALLERGIRRLRREQCGPTGATECDQCIDLVMDHRMMPPKPRAEVCRIFAAVPNRGNLPRCHAPHTEWR